MRTMVILAVLAACGGDKQQGRGDDQAVLHEASLRTRAFAFEAFTMWAQLHVEKQCPDKIDDLAEYLDRVKGDRVTDPWGNRYNLFCGKTLPAGVKGAGVTSNGPDGKPGTPDDIRSWDPIPAGR